VEGRTKQIFGGMISDGRLVSEGKEQVRKAEVKPQSDNRENDSGSSRIGNDLRAKETMLGSTGQGIVRDQKGEEQPKDKDRAQAAHTTQSDGSVSREATNDAAKPKRSKPQ
jgi:hypothetical protein